jgi:hypothetical protein
MLRPAFPDGHFYSPVVDPDEAHRARRRICSDNPEDPYGIDFRPDKQRELLHSFSVLGKEFDYPEKVPRPDVAQFYERNGKFKGLDARMLFCMLRRLRPKRVIEVGSGFSSLLTTDVNRRFLEFAAQITCIEPFPPDFSRESIPDLRQVLKEKVQDVPLAMFQKLERNDILFIDSSHVIKTGSDVSFLHLEVLPRLHDGVVIHVQDIFFPEDYPREWVMGEQGSWSEQYLIRALLTHSLAFAILFGCHYAFLRLPSAVREVFGENRQAFWGLLGGF